MAHWVPPALISIQVAALCASRRTGAAFSGKAIRRNKLKGGREKKNKIKSSITDNFLLFKVTIVQTTAPAPVSNMAGSWLGSRDSQTESTPQK